MAAPYEHRLPAYGGDGAVDPAPPPVESVGARPRHAWRDILVVAAVALLSLLLGETQNFARVVIGTLAVLVGPGYALTCALFPTDEYLTLLERLALALGLSLALIAVAALALDQLPRGLSPGLIRGAVVSATLALLVVAAVRRQRALPAAESEPAPPPRSWQSRAVRFTQTILAANLVVAALAFVLSTGDPIAPTEFFVLGREDLVADYPHGLAVGDSFSLHLGIRQQQDESGQYRVIARHGGAVVATAGPVSLAPGQEWETELRLTADRGGADQELVLELLRPGDSAPYRTLRLWIDVTEGRPR